MSTKEKILDAALTPLAESGYDGTQVLLRQRGHPETEYVLRRWNKG